MRKLLVLLLLSTILNAISLKDAIYTHKQKGVYHAIPLYIELANEDNSDAMAILGKIYIFDNKVIPNYEKAKKYLDKAIKLKNARAMYILGRLHQLRRGPYYDEIDAYNSFVDSANGDYARAYEMVGKFLLHGKAVQKDYKKAIYYFKEASKRRIYSANCYIAYMYANGFGVFPNFGRAHVFAKEEYKKGDKLCVKVWNDFNLSSYIEDKGWKIGDYLKPIR